MPGAPLHLNPALVIDILFYTRSSCIRIMSKLFEKTPQRVQKLYSNKEEAFRSVGKLGTGHKETKFILGLALDEYLNIFIVDTGNMRIKVFTFDGYFITNFGREMFLMPYAIAVHDKIAVVSDTGLRQVIRFDGNECTRNAVRDIKKPMGIAIDTNYDVYVADALRGRVVVLNGDLKLTREIGKGKLTTPKDVKLRGNQIIVCDNSTDYNVHIFNMAGNLLKSIIKLKQGNGPLFICIDKFFNIAVSDKNNREISISTCKGKMFQHWFTSGRPTGIEITPDGTIVRANYDFALIYFH